MTDIGNAKRQAIHLAFRKQIDWCDNLGSRFTASLLTILAEDLARGGPMTAFLADWPGDPEADALPLRLAGALHALVLAGDSPPLMACYPPSDAAGLAEAVRHALETQAAFVRTFIVSPPQTNEVARSAVLAAGFLWIAAATDRPLCLREIGASAGLNLAWNRYRYRLGGLQWGDPASPLLLAPQWEGLDPPLGPVDVADRRGCDVAPLDLRDPAQCLRLRAYVWADQAERLARLDRAIAIAGADGVRVEQADAADWVTNCLQDLQAGCTTVLYHSIMWQYMPAETRGRIEDTIAHAGRQATPAAPFAWLRFELPRPNARPELLVDLWPGGHHHQLASADAHVRAVVWHGAEVT